VTNKLADRLQTDVFIACHIVVNDIDEFHVCTDGELVAALGMVLHCFDGVDDV